MEPDLVSRLKDSQQQSEKYESESSTRKSSNLPENFRDIGLCNTENKETGAIAASLNGTLLRQTNAFPYYMLVAFEAGGILRAILLLIVAPIASFLSTFVSTAAGIQVLIFVSMAGLKMKKIQSAVKAVLPKFFCEDVHPTTWTVFSAFGTRYLLTSTPRILVENFAKEFLGVDQVFGTELKVTKNGRATGLVEKPGVLVGHHKTNMIIEMFGSQKIDVGLSNRDRGNTFVTQCKEGFVVPKTKVQNFPKDKLPKMIIFHDGRFVRRPTPLVALVTLLWIPVGFFMALLRLSLGVLPFPIALRLVRLLGVRVKVNGHPPPAAHKRKSGVLFVCNHRTLLDPVFLSLALGRRVPALTYSISRVSEVVSPIKTVRMTRERDTDAELIRKFLEVGDLCVCPEGTTCREPFLLRFSAMFAELTNEIVPVAVNTEQRMFHGSTATGWKGMDLFFFLMNPAPVYEVTFLKKLPPHLTAAGGKSSHEVANYIQLEIARILKFECTNFTRKDKYGMLAGTDGSVKQR